VVDLNSAILYGQLVNAAYDVPITDLTNHAGQTVSAGIGANPVAYKVVTSIFANDLATDINKSRATITVGIGLALQSDAGDVVIAIRGTEGIYEWIHDASFLMVPCPFLASGGHTEDGFTAMYLSMTTSATPGSPKLVPALAAIAWPQPVKSVTICGHSLGGALATLLALDVAANYSGNAAAAFKQPAVYTYASPKTGGSVFADMYNHAVPNTIRIANRMDLVPKLPLPPLYEHVDTLFDLNPIVMGVPPKLLLKAELACEHILTSYLHMLSLKAGGAVLALKAGCEPPGIATLPPIQ
jgi:Lipase (class 3)